MLSPATFAQLTIASDVISTATGTTISTDADIILDSRDRNFGESSWHLVRAAGTEDQQISGSTNPTAFYNLFINGGGTKTFNGTFGVANQLNLINGIVNVLSDQRFALSAPSVLQDGYGSDSYIDGMLIINIGESSRAIYPVGNSGTYTLIELSNISGSSPIIGIDANKTSIGTLVDLPQNVDDYSKNWNWELALFSDDNTFNASNITIPLLQEDKTQFDGEDYKPIVLYQNPDGFTSNLDNASGVASRIDPDITSAEVGGKGFYFAGKIPSTELIIHNIITPNGDNTNDYLVIENLNLFPENEIMVVDRYGVEIFSRSNYVSPDADSAIGEDFTFLPPGNYICILKYSDGDNENTIKQTISVIK